MPDAFYSDPPLLTEMIEAGLQRLDDSTAHAGPPLNPELELLRAQMPELMERALLRVKPQLLAEFEAIVRQTLQK
jgi:hypothetical protein